MKDDPTTAQKAEPLSPPSRPPPFLHSKAEPEYDTEQVARRAAKVTGVLEQILQEAHPILPTSGTGPEGARARP